MVHRMHYITTKEIAAKWGYSTQRARQIAAARGIKSELVGQTRLFNPADMPKFKPGADGRPPAKPKKGKR